MAKKIRKTGAPEGRGLVRLFLTMSIINLPGMLVILGASLGIIAWLYAIPIFIISGVVGWGFILWIMSRMGLLRCLRRSDD